MKKLRFYKGSKLFSVALILFSGLIAAGLLWGANMYYDIDTGKIIVQEVQNVISAVSPQFKVAYDTALTKYLQISVADTGKTTIVTSHGLDINATGTSIWETTAGDLTIRATTTGSNVSLAAANVLDLNASTINLDGSTAFNIGGTNSSTTTIKTVTLNIGASGNIYATSSQSISLSADDDFYLTFDAANVFSLKGGTTEYLGIIPGVTLGDDATSTTIDGSLITLSGNSQVDGTLTVSATSTGAYDVTFYGTSANNHMVWDQSANKLVITGVADTEALKIASGDVVIQGKITVGTDGTGYKVVLYGDETGTKLEWDDAAKKLIVTGVSGAEALRIAAGNAVIAAGSLTVTNTSTQAVTALTVRQNASGQNIVEFKDSAGTTVFYVDFSGNTVISGDLEVRGGDITTNQATFNLLNTTASTINFAGAASTINFGTSTATTTVSAGASLTIEFSTSTGGFILRSESPVVKYLEISSDGTLTLRSGGNADLVLDAASGAVRIAGGDTLYVDNVAIGGEGELKGIVPIFGFDLPAQTASTSFVKISRTIENYPFSDAATGTSRVHKLVIRYSASSTVATGTNAVEMRVSTSTGATYSSFYLPRPVSNDIEKGEARIVSVDIPTTTAWWLDVRNATTSSAVRIFQIFLAAFDKQ